MANAKQAKIYIRTNTNEWQVINLQSTVDSIQGLKTELDKLVLKENIYEDSASTTPVLKKSVIPPAILGGMTYGGLVQWQDSYGDNVLKLTSEAKYLLDTNEDTLPLSQQTPSQHEGLFYITENNLTVNSVNYQAGDWLLAASDKWEKIDNTDAITSVNKRTGIISIYKGEYKESIQYYAGDIVSCTVQVPTGTSTEIYQDLLFLCVEDVLNDKPSFTHTKWKIFGVNWEESITELYNSYLDLHDNIYNELPKFVVNTSTPPETPYKYPADSIWVQLIEE